MDLPVVIDSHYPDDRLGLAVPSHHHHPGTDAGGVTGAGKHPLYAELTSAVPHARGDKEAFRGNLRGYGMTPTEDPEVLWNFEKFLVSARGEVVDRFAPDITPDDEQITAAIERELQAG